MIFGVFVLCDSAMTTDGLTFCGSLVTKNVEERLQCAVAQLAASRIPSPEEPRIRLAGKTITFLSAIPGETVCQAMRRLAAYHSRRDIKRESQLPILSECKVSRILARPDECLREQLTVKYPDGTEEMVAAQSNLQIEESYFLPGLNGTCLIPYPLETYLGLLMPIWESYKAHGRATVIRESGDITPLPDEERIELNEQFSLMGLESALRK